MLFMETGLATHFRDILVMRFFSNFFASPAMAVAGGTINNVWPKDKVGLAISVFALSPFTGTILSPNIGGFEMEHKSWRWTM